MEPSVLEMTKDIVKAQIDVGELAPDDVHKVLRETHAQLMTLHARHSRVEDGGYAAMERSPSEPVDWRQSITKHAITCLECGAVSKQLSRRHLREHDLNARSYRAKYNIPRTLPLAARETTARRRKVVQETRPWEKTPRYLSTQGKKTSASKKKAPAKKASAKKKRANRS